MNGTVGGIIGKSNGAVPNEATTWSYLSNNDFILTTIDVVVELG